MPKWKPFESMKLEPETKAELQAEYRQLLEKLGEWHDEFAKGRKVQLDKSLGKSPGCMADVIAGRRSVTLDTLLAFLSDLGTNLPHLCDSLQTVRAPAMHSLFPAVQTLERSLAGSPRRFEQLWSWADRMRTARTGARVVLDHRLVLRKGKEDREAAIKLAETHVGLLEETLPESVEPDSASSLCRVLGCLGALYRKAHGDLAANAEALLLALKIEARIDEPSVRSFLYRECAYLLCNLGHLSDAMACADSAVTLCLVDPKGEGLGESLYVRASMARWNNSLEYALQSAQASIAHLKDNPNYRAAVSLTRIYLLFVAGRSAEADETLRREQEGILGVAPELNGSLVFVRALIHSVQGREDSADRDFETASHLIAHENPTDKAILLLYRCAHLVKYKRMVELSSLADELTAVAGVMRPGSAGEAAISAAITLVLAGEATPKALLAKIAIIERPWANRAA